MEKLFEVVGQVEKVEENLQRGKDGAPDVIVRTAHVYLPGENKWDRDKVRVISDALKVGDSVRIVAVSIPALSESEVAAIAQ